MLKAALDPTAFTLLPVFDLPAIYPKAFTFRPPTLILFPKHIYRDELFMRIGTLLKVAIPAILGRTALPDTVRFPEIFALVADRVVMITFADVILAADKVF